MRGTSLFELLVTAPSRRQCVSRMYLSRWRYGQIVKRQIRQHGGLCMEEEERTTAGIELVEEISVSDGSGYELRLPR